MRETKDISRVWSLDGEHEGTVPLKPMLTPEEQVAALEDKGITFKRCSEEEAIRALTERNTYLHLTSYRKLFQKHTDGPDAGKYVNLDFADLLDLDELDSELRGAMLAAAYDVERLVKTKLIARISMREDEDGYSIVADFMESQEKKYRKAIERDMKLRMNVSEKGDIYTGGLISRYEGAMPVWVFLEVCTFGAMLAFYLFVAERYDDDEMKREHYALKGVKSLRNCCSHGSCIVNGLDGKDKLGRQPSILVYDWLNSHGIENSGSRKAKLKNGRVQQITETLLMFDKAGSIPTSTRTAESLITLSSNLENACGRYGQQNDFVSYLGFLKRLIDSAL